MANPANPPQNWLSVVQFIKKYHGINFFGWIQGELARLGTVEWPINRKKSWPIKLTAANPPRTQQIMICNTESQF